MTEHAKRFFILGTAGHIDHGKTSLVRALTGIDTDRLPEEKKRGITIDIGFARLDLDDVRLGIVDVPGHERFIKNMVAGASGVDIALLVVAADDSIMPQTREHLEILQLLGLKRGAVAITKADLVDESWLELVCEEVRDFVRGTFLEGAPIVVTSAATGRGLDELRRVLRSLCDQVAIDRPQEFFRMAIDRSFPVQGYGTVVTGSVWSGQLRVGDEVEWLPVGRVLRVRSLQNHEETVEVVFRGQRAAVNLGGVHHSEIVRGHEIATPGLLKPSQLLTVELRVLESSPFPIKHRKRIRLHIGTNEVLAEVTLLDRAELRPGDSGLAQLHTSAPVMSTWGQPFVVRAESPLVTLGGGRVLQPVARRVQRRQLDRIEQLERLTASDSATRAEVVASFYGLEPWTELDLARDVGVGKGEASGLIETLKERGTLVELPLRQRRSLLLHRDTIAALEQRVLRRVEQLHAANPLILFHPVTHVLAKFRDQLDEGLLLSLVGRLLKSGELVGSEQAVARKGYVPQLTQAERRLKERAEAAIVTGGLAPPEVGALARELSAKPEVLQRLLHLAAAEGKIVEISSTLFISRAAADELCQKVVRALEQKPEGLTVAEIRDVLGTTRKYAVPYCEYLDRIGVTERRGDIRVLARDAASAAAT